MIYNIYAVGDSLRNIRKKYRYTQNDMAESLVIRIILRLSRAGIV